MKIRLTCSGCVVALIVLALLNTVMAMCVQFGWSIFRPFQPLDFTSALILWLFIYAVLAIYARR